MGTYMTNFTQKHQHNSFGHFTPTHSHGGHGSNTVQSSHGGTGTRGTDATSSFSESAESHALAEQTCPMDSVLSENGACQKVHVIAPSMGCVDEAEYIDGTCVLRQTEFGRYVCNEGFQLINGHCERTQHVLPLQVCGVGQTNVGGECISRS